MFRPLPPTATRVIPLILPLSAGIEKVMENLPCSVAVGVLATTM